MGLGISLGGGDFKSYVKIDSRSGRVLRRKNVDKGETSDVDVTNGFTAVFDLANVEVGWAMFTAGSAPAYVMVPIGQPIPPKPQGDWKQGVKFEVALASALGGGIHEFATTAKAVLGAIDALHTEYAAAPEAAAGKLPIVAMTGTRMVESKMPNGSTNRNYAPVFEIKGWTDRPEGLAGTGAAPTSAPAPAAPPPANNAAANDAAFG